MKLKICKINENAIIPSYAHDKDSGLDLCSCENNIILNNDAKLISTGIIIQLPPNTEAQIRPRSGLALNNNITVLNAPGTIDEGYRGEIKVLLINHGERPFEVKIGDRIAQMVIVPVLRPDIEEVEELDKTSRGENGFGSTGISIY